MATPLDEMLALATVGEPRALPMFGDPPPVCPPGSHVKPGKYGWICATDKAPPKKKGGKMTVAELQRALAAMASRPTGVAAMQVLGKPRSGDCGGSCSGSCDACKKEANVNTNMEMTDVDIDELVRRLVTELLSGDSSPGSGYIPGTSGLVLQPTGGCAVYRGWGGGIPVSLASSPCSAEGCNPQTPGGIWPIPVSIAIPAASTFELKITQARDANLLALVVTRVSGASIDDQSISGWRTSNNVISYPEFGTNSTVPNPNNALVPLDSYGAVRILDGQNALPPWVARYNLHDTNSVLSVNLTNADALVAARVDGFLVLNFG